jgi:putative redox protein
MSDSLANTIAATDRAFRDEPRKAQATFKSESCLGDGFRSEVRLRHHAVTVDEPTRIGGTDAGPTPVELVLAALGTCQEITYRAFATALGISLEGVAVKVEGDIDFRGFFAIDDRVRPGFHTLRVHVRLTSSAAPADLERLREAVNTHCPVLDMLSRPVPVSFSSEVVPA